MILLKPKPQFIVVILLALAFQVSAQTTKPLNGIDIITGSKIKAHVDYLASDSLLGRNTPSKGLDSAAVYIVKLFKENGILPFNNNYYQPVPLTITSLGKENLVEINNNGIKTSLAIKTQFVPYEVTGNGDVSGSLVFVGYGITAPEYNYDDYQGIDVKGKIVVVLRHEPGELDTASTFAGLKNTQHAFVESKVKNAIHHGAAGVLVLTDPLNHLIITPRGFPWPSLSRIIPEDALPMHLTDEKSNKIPVVHVGEDVIKMMFGSVDSLKSLQRTMDRTLKPKSQSFPMVTVRIKTSTEEKTIHTSNIVGFIPGTDPVLKNEYVIVGAHYDHVGYNKSHAPGEDYIINGADDNASGTAGMLAVAEAFAKNTTKPKRSLIFIGFTAEEKGLYGSEAYVNNPAVPVEKTVAMINLDMIGRNHIDTLYLVEGKESPDVTDIIRKENASVGFTIVEDEELAGRSDYDNFYKKDIPFAFFFAGLHPDYHTVRDNPNTINPEKAARISVLVYKTAWNIANDNKRYTIIKRK
jgi:hypothetical protein